MRHSSQIVAIIYVIITYSVTWMILFPLSTVYNELNLIQRELWHSLGSIGPAVGGIFALYLLKRKKGLKLLKVRILKYSGKKLLIFAFSPLIILIITLIIESLLGFFKIISFFQENNILNFGLFIVFILPSICYGLFEEIGWRGYLLPALQEKFNALSSTLILTVIWWFWHFPTFFYRSDFFFGFVLMFPLLLSGSIVITFLFNQSKGSVLMVIFLHISYDLVTSHQISITAIIIVSTFYVFMDVRILKVYGIENFSTLKRATLELNDIIY
ncbi:MAG: CPBP family intramembrane metalloprotease [Promethearchaeota archaeon]|nr:MAG: CPBP family intramembrane metalloprotease [Candidatus Lokiarchaeota archaeon]